MTTNCAYKNTFLKFTKKQWYLNYPTSHNSLLIYLTEMTTSEAVFIFALREGICVILRSMKVHQAFWHILYKRFKNSKLRNKISALVLLAVNKIPSGHLGTVPTLPHKELLSHLNVQESFDSFFIYLFFLSNMHLILYRWLGSNKFTCMQSWN